MLEENKNGAEEENQELESQNQSENTNNQNDDIINTIREDNKKLNDIKRELTDALEKSTQKYYEQLDINADFSDKLAKNGAELAIAKVKVDNLENEIEKLKSDSDNQINKLNDKILQGSPQELEKLKQDNNNLSNTLQERELELEKSKEAVTELQSEVDDLRKNLIDIGNYKEQVDKNSKDKVLRLENRVSELEATVREKQRNYDRMATDLENNDKIVKNLQAENEKLNTVIESHSKRGLIDRLSNKPIEINKD